MNETKYLWITNIPSKCKSEDVNRVLRRHGDIKTTKILNYNSYFNLIIEYLDPSSAVRAVHSQNQLKGNILKVEYCDSIGNPWISFASRRSVPFGCITSQELDRKAETMLVDRSGPSSSIPSHHHLRQSQQQQRRSSPQSIRLHPAPSSSNRQSGLPGTPTTASDSLKVIFTPPPNYAETQIKQTLCHELHKFGKTYHVNLLPATATGGRQTRVALVVFRRAEDEKRAFLAFRNVGRCLFGAPAHVEFCSVTDPGVLGSSLPIQSPPISSSVPVHSATPLSVPATARSPIFSLPTRSLIVYGLTAGPNGPVTEVQLNTAFQRFGAILHVHMRPASSSAIIEFVELRGSTRAMTTHQRDPLRLGGRPLRLLYTPSRPVNCLFINDLPASLIYHSEGEIKVMLSRVVPVAQVSKVTRSQEASLSTTVHTCALIELASQDLAIKLLDYLRSPDSPLFLASLNQFPESLTAPRLPTFVCSVDYASPKQLGKVVTPAKISEPAKARPVGGTLRPSLPLSPVSRPSRPRNRQCRESSTEEHSRSSPTSISSLSNTAPPPTPMATFPSQRWNDAEAPLFISQRRFPYPFQQETTRGHGATASLNLSEEARVYESMYDKIKRRTEGQKERRKRPSLDSEGNEDSRSMKRRRRRKQQVLENGLDGGSVNEYDYEGSTEDLEEELDFLSEKYKLQNHDLPSRRHKFHRSMKNSFRSSLSLIESRRQNFKITQLPSKLASTTITRRSLGMSVPMTVNYHAISKTSSFDGESRLARFSSTSSESTSGNITSDDMDVKPTLVRLSSPKKAKLPPVRGSENASIGQSADRFSPLIDVDGASLCSNLSNPTKRQVRYKRVHTEPAPSSKMAFKKTQKRNIYIQSTPIKSSRATSSSLSTDDKKNEEKDRISKWSSGSKFCFKNNKKSSKRQKPKSLSKIKTNTRKAHPPNGIISSSSSVGLSRRHRRSVDEEGVSASTPFSCANRLAKPIPALLASDFHVALSEPDDVYSLDDFDRFSANTALTASTEAMEISPETGDEEPENLISEWFTRMSANHSESEGEPGQDRMMEEEEESNMSDYQKSTVVSFEDINILNVSKEGSFNLSNRDAIGDIRMDDQPSPRLNESSDKSSSKSLVELSTESVNPPLNEVSSLTVPAIFKPQPPPTSPKIEVATLPPPPPPQNAQQILSPYSSASPTQSLCSACSRSSPSPIVTAPVQNSHAGTAANFATETTTCTRTTVSLAQEMSVEKPTSFQENRDLKRYVQSVIERVKAETGDDSGVHRPSTSITPITSPSHHPVAASSPLPTSSPPPLPTSLCRIDKKGASPTVGRRTSGATQTGLVLTPSSPLSTHSAPGKMLFESSGVSHLSIPGVNVCAPLSDASSSSPSKLIPDESKTPRSSTRRRARMATATAVSFTTTTKASTVSTDIVSPKQPADPYEPNFDDSPPLVMPDVNATSPLVVNMSLASEHTGSASSVTTAEESVTNNPLKENSTRCGGMDSIDEIIANVCCGRFDVKSYLDSWGLQSPTSNAHTEPSTVVTTPAPTTATTTMTVKPSETKTSTVPTTTSSPIFTAIINALQSITGTPVVIGGGTNCSAGRVKQSNPGTGQQLPQKSSTVAACSSPPTISATTITFPVLIKNLLSSANSSIKNAPAAAEIKTSLAISHPLTMTTALSNLSQHQQQQMFHQQGVPNSQPPSSTSSTEDPYRNLLGSDNNPVKDLAVSSSGPTRQTQQCPIFNPRGFTSPPPRYPPFASMRHQCTPPRLPNTLPPWSMSSMPAFPPPMLQESAAAVTAAAPTTNAFALATVLEKLSCLIEPELVLSVLQAAIQEGQHLDSDLLASVVKMFQKYDAVGDAGNIGSGPTLSNATNLASTLSQVAATRSVGGGSDGGSGQYQHSSRVGDASTTLAPRTGSFDQAYPLVWQGRLSLKNTEVSVALHYVQGNSDLLRACISTLAAGGGGTPQQALVTSGGPLRIVQRMRLEASQLDAVQRKITQEGASCVCVAFASGANRPDLVQQNIALSEGFIRYMLEKGAAGIINVGQPGSIHGLYVVHIFPPCEFSHALLRLAAPDLHQSILQVQLPHLLIVITTV